MPLSGFIGGSFGPACEKVEKSGEELNNQYPTRNAPVFHWILGIECWLLDIQLLFLGLVLDFHLRALLPEVGTGCGAGAGGFTDAAGVPPPVLAKC